MDPAEAVLQHLKASLIGKRTYLLDLLKSHTFYSDNDWRNEWAARRIFKQAESTARVARQYIAIRDLIDQREGCVACGDPNVIGACRGHLVCEKHYRPFSPLQGINQPT